jgi:soluble lytic murein transglycosylase-like protein
MRKIYPLAALFCALIGTSVGADTPKPFPEFSAKRVKPPKSGSSKRITIQIDPAAQPAAPAPSSAGQKSASKAPNAPVGSYDWFWAKVSPDAAKSGPGRLEVAMRALAANGGVASPRLQHMQSMAKANGIDILKSTIGTEVSPALVLAVMAVESAGDPKAESRAGAQGLMQLMPATAARFDVLDSFQAEQNISGGVKYLNWLMQEFKSDPILVLAGYNSGEGNVRKHGGVPPFAETRDYVPKVLAAFQVARGLCVTPPQLISDGCVFTTMK